jgi:hypothetical protein
MWRPDLARNFGLTYEQLERGYWSLSSFVGMIDFLRESAKA